MKTGVFNALADSCSYPAFVAEMRLVFAVLIQVGEKEKLSHTTEFTITADDLSDAIGWRKKDCYRALKDSADALFELSLVVHSPDRNGGKPDKCYAKTRVVSQCVYLEGEECIKFNFAPSIIPYITKIRSRFNNYQLRYLMKMKFSYGIRLYMLCLPWMTGFSAEKKIAVDDFRELLGLGKRYKRIGDLKNKVITPAIKEVNKYSNLRVEFDQIKTDRKVTHLHFVIMRKAPESKLNKQQAPRPVTKLHSP